MQKNIRNLFVHNKILSFIYCLCTIGVMWTGVWRDIGSGAQWALAINCIGLCVFPMIICRFKLNDFIKLPYFIWIILFSALVYPAYSYLKPDTDYNAQVLSALINIGLYGIVVIRILYFLIKDKEYEKVKVSILFWLWLAMLLWAVLSICKTIYPIWFLVMFGALYISPADNVKKSEMTGGIVIGIIVSFFWIQGRALLYRPYDTGAPYYGHFTNPNINCMFYLTVYATWLSVVTKAVAKKSSKWILLILYVLTFAMLDFIYLTGSRGGALSAGIMTFVYLIIDLRMINDSRIKRFFVSGLSAVIIAVLMFVPVYACVRYIPALRHHPIWYSDYSEEKVHSWDPIDSEKYTSLEEALGNFLSIRAGSLGLTVDFEDKENLTAYSELNDYEGIAVPEEYTDYSGFVFIEKFEDGITPGTDERHPAGFFSQSGSNNNLGLFGIRKYIYRYFIQRLNLFGHEEIYPYVYFGKPARFFGHTHNTFLQIAYCFGIPSGITFIFLSIVGVAYPFVITKSNKSILVDYSFSIFFLIAFITYGMIECLSLTGDMMYSIFFLAFLPFMRKN